MILTLYILSGVTIISQMCGHNVYYDEHTYEYKEQGNKRFTKKSYRTTYRFF